MTAALADGYRLADGVPDVDSYLSVRARAGLSPRTREQAVAALPGTWAGRYVVHEESGAVVGMGRVLGDGGWYFHLADIAVLPEHQRRGLGAVVLMALVEHIRRVAPPDPWITLLADPPGVGLYRRHGFEDTAELGMAIPVS